MEKLKLELAQLDVLFSRRREMKQQTGSGKGRPAVVGFEFPLKAEDDVERLEVAVNSDATIRSQYIQLLKAKKLKHIDLVDCFPMLFGSSSMEGYTWSGCRMVKFPKKSMKNYSIFNDCMLDAWESHGMDIIKLEENIKQAIHRIRRRRLAKNSYDKRKHSSEV